MVERFIVITIESGIPTGWTTADSLEEVDRWLRGVGHSDWADAIADAPKTGGRIEVLPGLWLLQEFK